MPIKALYSECNGPMWLEVARRLARDPGWQPVYWVGAEPQRSELARDFPEAVFHEKLAAIKGLPAEACAGLAPAHPDAALLRDLAFCEGMVLRMMDRMDPDGGFSLRERLDLYYRYLGYWEAVLERYQPQVAFFCLTPHMAYDYVLYALCQRRGIPTVMLEMALMPSRVYALSRFEEPENLVVRAYRRLLAEDQGQPLEFSPLGQQHLEALARDYQAPFYVSKTQAARPSPWLYLKSLPRQGLNQALRLHRVLTRPAPANYLKVRGKSFQEASLSHLGFEYQQWRGRRIRQSLKEAYGRLARRPDLSQPYVFLPLHYQPEMSTMPGGEYYEDQRVLARLLHSCLPAGWRLYIKEHPVQVSAMYKGHYSRTPDYYQELAALPGVTLVPLEQTSFELIDQARATATITGQAAWEAVNRGQPALTFGYCWYRGCEGVFHTPDRPALLQALAAIQAGYRVDRRKVRLFAKAVEEAAPPGFVVPMFGQEYGLDEGENIATLAALLADFWRREIAGTAA